MKQNKVTMQIIADQLGISKVSVSKALNGLPGISPGLRKQIQEVATTLGYERRSTTGNRLAFVVLKRFFLENENFYTTIYYYLNKLCQETGHILSSFVINKHEEEELEVPALLTAEQIDGIFVAGEMDEGYIKKLSDLEIPVLLIDFYKISMDLDCVITDNFYLGTSAANHLIANGHSKIGFVGDIDETASILDRYYGYVKALRTHSLEINDSWRIVNNDPKTGIYWVDADLPREMPTAFVCHCDMAAYFLMQTLGKAGYSVPQDVSIVSFDNTDLSNSTAPKLSTFDIDRRKIASEAFDRMMLRIGGGGEEPQRIYIDSHLISRESVRNMGSRAG